MEQNAASKSARLIRQLKGIFGDENIAEKLSDCVRGLDSAPDSASYKASMQALQAFAENLPALLTSVDMYYDQLEGRAALAQKSMETRSDELADNSHRLDQLNRLFETMINSLGQGFFIFDRDGFCLATYSKACENLLNCIPAGLPLAEVLAIPYEKRETFFDWITLLFDEMIDFEDLVAVGPKTVASTTNRVITLEYKPVRDENGRLEMVVVIATDRTEETKARKEAEDMQAFATMMVAILKDKDRFRRFVAATRQVFKQIYLMINTPPLKQNDLAEIRRHLHTLKGATGTFGVLPVMEAIHNLESRLSAENDLSALRAILLMAVPEIDRRFETLLYEHRDVIADFLVERAPSRTIPIDVLEDFGRRIQKLGQSAYNVHRDFMDEIVAVPLRRIFSEFDPVMQQVGEKLGKRVDPIRFIGDEISVIPESIDAFRASLIHVFRNLVDHGIEPEIIRDQRGKPPAGQVTVEFRALASNDGAYLRIIISDDGNGIDIWRIRDKMERKGVDVAGLSGQDLMNKIFDAGFSTTSAVTEFSGHGVGLDAVKAEVERLGGTIDVRSDLGLGTAFIIELPFDNSGIVPKFSARLKSAA